MDLSWTSVKDKIMPLKSGSSQEIISKNIETEMHAHPSMDPKQAAAIAYSKARGDGASWSGVGGTLSGDEKLLTIMRGVSQLCADAANLESAMRRNDAWARDGKLTTK
jgi:hypothetical protein